MCPSGRAMHGEYSCGMVLRVPGQRRLCRLPISCAVDCLLVTGLFYGAGSKGEQAGMGIDPEPNAGSSTNPQSPCLKRVCKKSEPGWWSWRQDSLPEFCSFPL